MTSIKRGKNIIIKPFNVTLNKEDNKLKEKVKPKGLGIKKANPLKTPPQKAL